MNAKEKIPQYRDSSISILRRKKMSLGQVIGLFLFYAIGNHLPEPPMPLGNFGMFVRNRLARLFFKKVGRDAKVHGSVHLGSGEGIELGNHSSINISCRIACDTIIGDDVMLGPEVTILSSSHEFSRTDISMREQGESPRAPVVIGNDVWIGTRVIILPGVKIGDHSIVGAGSIVTKDVAEWSIVAGNPARFIRSRQAD